MLCPVSKAPHEYLSDPDCPGCRRNMTRDQWLALVPVERVKAYLVELPKGASQEVHDALKLRIGSGVKP